MSKTIFITGASSGIGKATAKHFQANGWNVVATMRKPENETELTQLDNVHVTRLDVLDLGSIHTAVQAGIEKFGKLDVLLNNAGYGTFGPVEVTPRESVVRQFNTNVIGLVDVTQAVLPHFRENKDGIVMNVSSIGGRVTLPLASLYNGTKWAVEGISEGMSFELAPFGVKVKIIEPGAIATDFGTRSMDFNNDESVAEYQPTVQKIMAAFGSMGGGAAPAELCAEVIWEAATDGKDQLRYLVGEDAKAWWEARQQDEVAFIAGISQQFGL